MGNRCLIISKNLNTGVYLHWNGGRDSVEPLLAYCKLRRERNLDSLDGVTALTTIAKNAFGSVYLQNVKDSVKPADSPGDNGIYIVNDEWDITDRIDAPTREQAEYDFQEMLQFINERQPEHDRLANELLNTKLVPGSELKLGDHVYRAFGNTEGQPEIVTAITRYEVRFHNGNLSHRDAKFYKPQQTPASTIETWPDDTLKRQEWRDIESNIHRNDGPAVIEYSKEGRVEKEEWWQHGKRHRTDGSAVTIYEGNSLVAHEEFWIAGKEVSQVGNCVLPDVDQPIARQSLPTDVPKPQKQNDQTMKHTL